MQDVTGKTPLHYAALYHMKETVRALLNRGARPHIIDMYGSDAYFYAKDSEIREIIFNMRADAIRS